MEKVKRIAALVAAIILPLFIIAGIIISEIGLCQAKLWFAAVFFVVIFAFAAEPIVKTVGWLIQKAKKQET